MKRKLNSIISLSLALLVCLHIMGGFMVYRAYAADDANYQQLNNITSEVGVKLDLASKTPLYDGDDNIVAYFFRGIEKGYAICDLSYSSLIEFSATENHILYGDSNQTYYYGGPFNYGVKNGSIIEDVDGKAVEREEMDFSAWKPKRNKSNVSATAAATTEYRELSYDLRTLSYNPDGICGATATAIAMMFYNDAVDGSYVAAANEPTSANGMNTVIFFRSYVVPGYPLTVGSTEKDITNGINSYLSSIGKSRRASYYTSFATVKNNIRENDPVIMGTTYYKQHWVVCHAYMITPSDTYVYVNNGYGQNNIAFSSSYFVVGVSL